MEVLEEIVLEEHSSTFQPPPHESSEVWVYNSAFADTFYLPDIQSPGDRLAFAFCKSVDLKETHPVY